MLNVHMCGEFSMILHYEPLIPDMTQGEETLAALMENYKARTIPK